MMNVWHRSAKVMAVLVLVVSPVLGPRALAQQGLISGWVIEVEDESGQSQADIAVSVTSEDETITVGSTAADGLVEIPFAEVEIADGTRMDVEIISIGGEFRVSFTPAGQRSEDCDEARESEDDDCDVLGGYFTWGRPGRYTVSTSGQVMMTDVPGTGSSPASGSPDPTRPFSVEVGGHFGRNIDFEEGFFGLDGRAYLDGLPYPIAIDVILSYYPVDEYFNAFAPSFYGSWVFDVAESVAVSAGLGLEFFRSSFDYEGVGSYSNTSTGLGARVEGRYQLNEKFAPVVDLALLNFDGGSEIRLKFGVRVRVLG